MIVAKVKEAIRSGLRKLLSEIENREVDALRREVDLLRNEMQENIAAIHRLEILTLNDRLDLLNSFGKALAPTRAGRTRDSMKPKGYSFGIITNGLRPEKLKRLIGSIRNQRLASGSLEILVAGRVSEPAGRPDVRTFPMEDAAAGGKLGAMRNVLAKAARFNKFVCLDDDFILQSRWVEAVEAVNDDFDLATGVIVNPDLSRYCDWVNYIGNCTFLRSYDEGFDKCQYVTGGYGIYKDYLFEEHGWDNDLGFYQGEDVRFSRALFEAGYQLKFIPQAMVMHDDERYRQKGYGIIRRAADPGAADTVEMSAKIETFCPQTLL